MRFLFRLYREWRFRRGTWIDRYGTRWVRERSNNAREFLYATFRLRRTHPKAEEYLRLHAEDYSWGALWLRHGQTFRSPSKQLCDRLIRENKLLPGGNCFGNSFGLSIALNEGLRRGLPPFNSIEYAEGLAVDPTGVYPHGWIVIDGAVYDPTWPGAYLATYFGVTFDTEWIQIAEKATGRIGITLEWERYADLATAYLEN
ncbi:MAG: hypothetical protein ABIT47_03060 [Candidatus Paceibacterota bacterium]